MKNIFMSIAALAIATTASAQTLIPSGGVYYPEDINNSGIVRVEFDAAVESPTAVIAFDGKTVNASMYEQGTTGRFWAVEVKSALSSEITANGTKFSLTVTGDGESVSADYTYMPVFPLTGIAPNNYSELSAKDETVTFTFDQAVSYDSIVVRSGSKETKLDGGNASTVTVKLQEAYWADVTGVNNSISVILMGTKADGTYINNMADGLGLIGAVYTYKETVELPTFVGVDQDPYWWLAQDLFGMDVEFDFNAPVNYDNASAIITFYNGNEEIQGTEITVSAAEMVAGQNWRTGNYYLSIPIPDKTDIFYDEEWDEWLFSKMTVTLKGVSAIGLSDPYSVSYDSSFPDEEMMKSPKSQSAKIGASMIENNETVDVFAIDGSLVKRQVNVNTINDLGRGLYIVNGKKILVK